MCAVTRSHNASAGASTSSGTGVSSARRMTSSAFGVVTSLVRTTTGASTPATNARPCHTPRVGTNGRNAARSAMVTGASPRSLNGANEQLVSSATPRWGMVSASAADSRGNVSPSGA
jgi:hypothetical protein